jgi:phospholipid transport system substrate-binding protein
MRVVSRMSLCSILFGLMAAPVFLWAASPMESIRETTDRVIEVLTDERFEAEEDRPKLQELVSEIVKERFDWEAIARGALSTHWRDLSRARQEEFTDLFARLMERTYSGRLDDYSGEEVIYLAEEMEGGRARVTGKFITRNKQEIPVEYRMRKKDGAWLVYDILIEGVSMVRNYRVQFNDIIIKSSYEELVRRINEKLESGF